MIKDRNTLQKKVIRETLGQMFHPTAEEVYEKIKKQGHRFSLTTVYRNLNAMTENGELKKLLGANADRFDSRTTNHYHFRCKVCGKLVDIPERLYDTILDEMLAKETGLQIDTHEIEFIGICAECALP